MSKYTAKIVQNTLQSTFMQCMMVEKGWDEQTATRHVLGFLHSRGKSLYEYMLAQTEG